MKTRLLFKNLPYELNELILLYSNEYGLNIIYGYEKNIKQIMKNNNYDKLLSSAIKYNIPFKRFYYSNYDYPYFIKSIKCKSAYWIDYFLNEYKNNKYNILHQDVIYVIINKGDIDLFKKCVIYSRINFDKNTENKILNIICKKGYVKMLDYFIKEKKFKISQQHLQRAIYYKRKNIVNFYKKFYQNKNEFKNNKLYK